MHPPLILLHHPDHPDCLSLENIYVTKLDAPKHGGDERSGLLDSYREYGAFCPPLGDNVVDQLLRKIDAEKQQFDDTNRATKIVLDPDLVHGRNGEGVEDGLLIHFEQFLQDYNIFWKSHFPKEAYMPAAEYSRKIASMEADMKQKFASTGADEFKQASAAYIVTYRKAQENAARFANEGSYAIRCSFCWKFFLGQLSFLKCGAR
jgi:hypothetical protein